MNDLISREEVLSKAFCAGLEDAQGNFYGSGHIVLADDVLKAPTVDAVEVVRCGECKKRGTEHCPMEEEYPWISNRPTDFCSYGERKDETDDN